MTDRIKIELTRPQKDAVLEAFEMARVHNNFSGLIGMMLDKVIIKIKKAKFGQGTPEGV